MEQKKFQNQNELPINIKVSENNPQESKEIDKVEDDINLRDLSEEEIEEMKTNDPDRYFEIIEKLIKEEERRNNEQIEEIGKLEEIKNKEELDRLYAKTDDDKWYDK